MIFGSLNLIVAFEEGPTGPSRLGIRTDVPIYGDCSLRRWSVAADGAQVGKGCRAQPSLLQSRVHTRSNGRHVTPLQISSHTSPPSCLPCLLSLGRTIYILSYLPVFPLLSRDKLPFYSFCSFDPCSRC